MTKRVLVTPEAVAVIEQLKQAYGPLMFHQSGGCCEGSYPHCFEQGGFLTGDSDVCLGEVAGCPFFMARDQFEYWKHTQLTLDVTDSRGASFSLETTLDKAFFIHSRLFTEAELPELDPIDGQT